MTFFLATINFFKVRIGSQKVVLLNYWFVAGRQFFLKLFLGVWWFYFTVFCNEYFLGGRSAILAGNVYGLWDIFDRVSNTHGSDCSIGFNVMRFYSRKGKDLRKRLVFSIAFIFTNFHFFTLTYGRRFYNFWELNALSFAWAIWIEFEWADYSNQSWDFSIASWGCEFVYVALVKIPWRQIATIVDLLCLLEILKRRVSVLFDLLLIVNIDVC